MNLIRLSPCWVVLILSLGLASATHLVNGTFGKSINLEAFVSLPAIFRLEWVFGMIRNVTMIGQMTLETKRYNDGYRGRCEMFENGTLRLDNLTHSDEGHYMMYIYEADDNFNTTIEHYDLKLFPTLYAPTLSVISDHIVDGKNVTLQCDAKNQNVTTYTFYRDQKPICSEPHVTCAKSFLDFTPITENDNASYTCTIENPVSTGTSNSLNVTVSVPVSAITLRSNTSDLLLWPGRDSVSLWCSSNGTDVSYSWNLDGALLPQDPQSSLNKSKLTISPVSTKDSGYFMCTARNWINSENSTKLYLNLASPVSAVTLTSNTSDVLQAGRDSVSFYCSAQGSAINFSWSLNGKPVSSNPPYYITKSDSPPNSNLTISPLSRNDAGPFICTATNLANSENSNTINLILAWNPEGNVLCLAKSGNDDEQVMLGCSWPDGNPPANVTMIFNDTVKTEKTNVTKNVSRNNVLQGSNITCLGDQMGKTSLCTLVLDTPQSPEHNNSAIIYIEEGETAVMTVTLISGLPAEFTWFHLNPHPVQIPVQAPGKFTVESNSSKSSLLVSQSTLGESGIYECRAMNMIGSETFNFNLRVTAKASVLHGMSRGAIAGILIGVLAILIIIAILIFILIRRLGRRKIKQISDGKS